MKNKEKFAKEIVELATKSQTLAVNQESKVIVCSQSNCKKCIFYTGAGRCCDKRKDWAESEYVEPKVFTEEEKAFIRACDNIEYVARNADGSLYFYRSKPNKFTYSWAMQSFTPIYSKSITNLEFKSVLWEDSEPTSREEILRCIKD